MRTTIFAAAAIAALAAGTSAHAADFNYRNRQAAPYAAPQQYNLYNWAGPYIGGNLGYDWGKTKNNPTEPSGVSGGIQAGYNWQNGPWVFGIEGDVQITGADDTFAPWKFSNPWFGTLRGRVGYTFNNVMFYGTAGGALGSLKAETFGLSESRMSGGWTAGLGVEFGFAQNWTAKAEFLYVDLSERNFSVTAMPNGYQFGVLRVGVNYHF